MTIEINISVQAAMLVLSENAGNLRAEAGTEIVFKTADPRRTFTLEFFTLSKGGTDSPFKCGATCFEVSANKPFCGVLNERVPKSDIGAFKYCVTSGALSLDPLIVVGGD
jgi:hypothetical protein